MDVKVGPSTKLDANEFMLLNCGVREDSLQSPLNIKEIKPVNPEGS